MVMKAVIAPANRTTLSRASAISGRGANAAAPRTADSTRNAPVANRRCKSQRSRRVRREGCGRAGKPCGSANVRDGHGDCGKQTGCQVRTRSIDD